MQHETRRAAREAAQRAAAESANDFLSSIDATAEVVQGDDADGKKKSRTKRWIGRGILIFVLLLLVAAGWLGVKALTVKTDFEAMQSSLRSVSDGEDVTAALDDLSEHAASAASNTSDPVWRAAEFIPALGDNFRGLRLAAQALDILAGDVGSSVLAMQSDGQGAVLERALPVLQQAGEELGEFSDELISVAASPSLIGPLKSGLAQVGDVVSMAQPALQVLPSMLGADGQKNYLLVFQNNAESLALGGSAASQALISADAGKIAIAQQASSASYDEDERVDVDVDYSAVQLYGAHLLDRVNTSMSRPDFPTAAALLTEWWHRDIGDDAIDGVISVDPIALGYLLKATGPITVGDVELTSENAVEILLSKSYEWWNPYDSKADALASDAFFASAAVSIFDKVSSGDFNVKDMIWAVNYGIEQGSIMAYSSDDELAAMLEGQRVSGVLPTDNDDSTVVGIYFRDGSGSKIDYYMHSAADVSSACSADGITVSTTTKLHLDISQADADDLPTYVQSRLAGAEHFRTEVFVYGPPGTTVESVTVGGEQAEVTSTDIDDLGRPVAAFATTLKPSEETTVTAVFSGAGEYGPLEVRTTPMINTTQVSLSDGCE